MRKFVTIAIAAMLAGQTLAENFTSGGLTYTVTGTNTVSVSSGISAAGVINIPAEIENADVTYVVTGIKQAAFFGCNNITYVRLPSTITTIGEQAFLDCDNLENISISSDNSHYTSENGVLFNKDKTELLYFPAGKTGSYTIPNTVVTIASEAFSYCSGLVSVEIPNSVTKIGYNTFYGTGLTSIEIPEGVKIIEIGAFGNSSLTSVTISKTVTEIASNSFYGCSALTEINVDNENEKYLSVDGVLFNKDTTEIIKLPARKTKIEGKYEIPRTVTKIGDCAFYDCRFGKISIPDGVKSIGEYAFAQCIYMSDISIPQSVESIGDYAFNNCKKLRSVKLSASLTHIGVGAFDECNKIEFNELAGGCYLGTSDNSYFALIKAQTTGIASCNIDGNCRIIAGEAFANCGNLTNVSVPNSVEYLGHNVFAGCNKLNYNKYGNALYLGNNEKPYIILVKAAQQGIITSCEIDGSCKIVAEKAFTNCYNLLSITIPESVKSIGDEVFYNCSMLKTVSIPESVTSIGKNVFASCLSLTDVSIPGSVVNIGDNAFLNCNALTIYCEAESKPIGWSEKWNPNDRPVVWGLGPNLKLFNTIVKANNNAYGSVSGSGIVPTGLTATITATPKTGYKFVKWSNGLTNTIETIVVTKDTTITAEFAIKTYTVTLSANNNTYGTVEGGGSIAHGSTATITAKPNTGYKFVKWSNGSTKATETITVTSDLNLTAEFAIKTYTVTVSANNSSYGTVEGGGSVAHGSTATITATPKTGYKFVKWSNGSTNATETITVTSDLNLTAEFVKESTTPDEPENPTDASYFTFNLNSTGHTAEVSGYTGTDTDVVIPQKVTIDGVEYTVTGIGKEAFWGTNIVSVFIPKTITNTYISFNDCANLTSINVDNENPAYTSENGVLFNKDKTTLICCPAGKTGDYIIPSTVTAIAERGFRTCAGLTSVTIPNGVASIGEFAFGRCTGLTSIVLPNSLKTIPTTMLAGCSSLESVTFGRQVETIGEWSFQRCTSLTKIVIPNTVKNIYEGAFHQCTGMDSVYIPNSVTTMQKWAFHECSNLTIYCQASSEPTSWDGSWNSSGRPVVLGCEPFANPATDPSKFEYNIISSTEHTAEVISYFGSDADIVIPQKVTIGGEEYTVTRIGDYAFTYENKLESVTIPGTVTEIGNNAFAACSNLTTIYIPNSVTKMGGYIFYECRNLQSLTIPKSVNSIGVGLCSFCTSLSEIVVENGNSSYVSVNGVLYNIDKTQLVMYPVGKDAQSFVFPETVESTARSSFRGCTNLTSVTFNDLLTTIGGYSFNGCSKLKTVTIKESVTTIGDCTFKGCSSLRIYCEAGSKPTGWDSNWNSDNRPVVWTYKQWTVTLSVNNGAYGTVSGGGAIYNGSTTTITAKPNTGYKFVKWSNGSTNATETITVTSDLSLTAEFAIKMYTVAVAANNSSYGTVEGGGSIAHGSTATITATPKTGYEFVKWSNGSTNATETITVTSDLNLTAEFAIKTYTVTLSANNSSYGTVEGGGSVAHGSTATITATPKTGYEFVKWSNGSTKATETITVTSDLSLTAEFAIKMYTVAVSANNSSYGTVEGGGSVAHGSIATITATSKTGCEFVKWSNGSTNATETITVTSDLSLTAEFAIKTYTVAVSANNSSYGTVEGGGSIAHGSTVTITATPKTGYEFVKWSNGSTNATETITVTSDLSLTAEFAIKTYTVTVSANNSSYGTVEGGGSVAHGSTATITATPKTGYKFVKWSNGLTTATETITVTSDLSLTAEFAIKTYTVTVSANNSSYGSVDGGGTINHGSIATITATPKTGYKFVKWSNGSTNATETITVTSDLSLTAEFVKESTTPDEPENPTDASYFTFNLNSTEHTAEVSGYTGADTDIVIPQKVTIDGEEYTVTSIGKEAFWETNIVSVFIPKTITNTYISFNDCAKLTSINVDNENPAYSSENGVLFNKDKTTLICCPAGKTGDYIIPSTVTEIAERGFRACAGLTSVTIPNGVASIGEFAFGRCTGLTSIELPNSLKTLPTTMLAGCSSLESVTFGSQVETIGEYAFQKCYSLTQITIPETVKSICVAAFHQCTGLDSIYIPASVTTMQKWVFHECSNLTIYCEAASEPAGWDGSWNSSDRPVVWGKSSGNNNEEFNPEDFTYGIISFSKMTVEIDGYNGTNSNIVIPSTVVLGGDEFTIVSIADETFKDCDNLISVTLPSTITSIGDAAFQNCSNLESVSLPNTIESIGACTFAECGSLTSVEIPNSVTFIGNSAFAESGLTSVVIPNSVTEISSYAFRDCADLASVEIPNSVATIGMCAFENCSELGTVKIPSSVSSIGIKAFDGCDNATFECEVDAKPEGWDEWWNYGNQPVVWSKNTAVSESAEMAVSIYAHGNNTIVVENANAEIRVYDAMGRMVVETPQCDVSAEIRVNGTGVYIVKTGSTVKRVLVK